MQNKKGVSEAPLPKPGQASSGRALLHLRGVRRSLSVWGHGAGRPIRPEDPV